MEEDGSEECNDDYCTPSVGQYFLASGGESCDAACAAQGKECDLTAITDAAQSVDHCKAVLTDLGMAYQSSGMYPDDDSGCTYHPGQTGWAQVMHTGRDQGTAPAPTCGQANSDSSRRRVCACTGTSVGNDCCAPLEINEPATCSNGFVPVRTGHGCRGYSEGLYTCCSSDSSSGPGPTASGVEYTDESGAARTAFLRAGGRVVLTAGALATPRLLKLSGLGERNAKIGAHLNDHVISTLTFRSPTPIHPATPSWSPPVCECASPETECLSGTLAPTYAANAGTGNTCEAGEAINDVAECEAAAAALAISSFPGYSLRTDIGPPNGEVSLNYAPNGCMVYTGEYTEYNGFYMNAHTGSATGTADHHKVCKLENQPSVAISVAERSGCADHINNGAPSPRTSELPQKADWLPARPPPSQASRLATWPTPIFAPRPVSPNGPRAPGGANAMCPRLRASPSTSPRARACKHSTGRPA